MSLTLKLALSPVLLAQALVTRRRMPRLPEPTGQRSGVAGALHGAPLSLLVAGDSSALGLGVHTQRDALAGPLAQQLAQACQARVNWRLVARAGLTTSQTLHLLLREASPHADVAVVVSGVNDVVDQVPSHQAVSAREALANSLRNAHAVQHVVFAPLPPIHHFPGLPQPLRWVAGADAQRHNAALQRWVRTRGDVSCVDMQMPLDPNMMAVDGFHPGEAVYRYCAHAIAQHIATLVWPQLQLRGSE